MQEVLPSRRRRRLLRPKNTAAPAITGTAAVGQTLTVSNGTWTNTPLSYTYSWNGRGTAIGNTYVVVAGDVGRRIICTVRASNAKGPGYKDSTPTAVVV